jgi:nicotinamidase-related amidase
MAGQPAVLGQTASGRTVKIVAKPEPTSIDLTRTAVIVIDMTNDFGSKGGMFDRAGIDISPIQQAVAPTAHVLGAARKKGIKVIYLSMAYLPDLSDVGPPESPNWLVHVQHLHVGTKVRAPDGTERRILVRDSWGTRVLNELRPETGEPLIYKTRYSGFYNTELDQTLRALGPLPRHNRVHDQRVRGIHDPRCDVPQLLADTPVRLLGRAHRPQPRQKQP